MTNPLIKHISASVPLSQEEIAAISPHLPVRKYKAGDLLLREGMISTMSYFNVEGCVRLYYLIDGEEKTTFFYTENQFIISVQSYTTGSPAKHYLECVEDCTLVLIPYEAEQRLLQQFPRLETFSRMSLERELANYQHMLSSYILSSPEQRYLNLLNHNPDLLQRVPLYQLASYIGVKAESLSRIRSRINRRPS